MLLITPAVTSMAQLKVYSDGSMTLDRDTSYSMSRFTVGETPSSTNSLPAQTTSRTGILSYSQIVAGDFNYGILGYSVASALTAGRAYGVSGIAGNSTSGYNYGVMGALAGLYNGAAVYGSTSKPTGTLVPGRYAGYFHGDAVVTGTATITSLNTPSDIRLKENVTYVGNDEGRADIHSRLKDIHVISYNLKHLSYDTDDSEEQASVEDTPGAPTTGSLPRSSVSFSPTLLRRGRTVTWR